jgi:hypothetical protein
LIGQCRKLLKAPCGSAENLMKQESCDTHAWPHS